MEQFPLLAHRVISLLRSNHLALVAKQTSRYRKISGTTPSSQRMCSAGTSGEGNKMRQFGKVDIPQEAFIAALKVDS
jgi:translation elongation factor EF-4